MANTDRDELRKAVMEQTALLDPAEEWEPDAASALSRFHARAAARERGRAERCGWRWWSAAIAGAVVAGLLIGFLYPVGRVAAQHLWQILTVKQVAIVAVKPWPEGVPSPAVKAMGIPCAPAGRCAAIPPIPARDAAEAARRVNFEPRLPHAFVLSGSPRLSTLFPVAAGMVVNTGDLEAALQKTGVADQTVPPSWNGVRLALHTSGLVIAEWPDAVLIQSLPLTLTAPEGFDFAAYSAIILRVMGVGPEEARRLAERAGTTPPWLAPFANDRLFEAGGRFTLEGVTLNNGSATLIEQKRENGQLARFGLFWTAPDRAYLLSGSIDRQLAIAVANAVQ